MEVIHERCAGIDISKIDVKVCIRVPSGTGTRRRSEVRTFSAVTSSLLAMRDWLLAEGITVVGMEATGVYWKPVFYLLEHDMECWLLNARHMKSVPGRKTDVKDSEWIATLVEHGLVRPSFVPPEPIRQLRDVTRYRTEIIRERTRETQRLEKLLEDTGIKLSATVSNILGVSGRAMLEALIAGERDPHDLADLAKGSMRRKTDALVEALTGNFTAHHAFLARAMLDRIDACTATETKLSEHIEVMLQPFRRRIELLVTIPGVDTRAAQVILSEIGADITRFPSAADLASWAGVCPGNHQSGGRTGSGKTRRRSLAEGRSRPGRRVRIADQGHLPRRPLPAHRRPPRQETRAGRPGALDPDRRLAHVHPRRRIRRPRRPLLHRTHRPGQADPTPGEPAQPTRLPSHPPNRRSCLTSRYRHGTVDFRIRRSRGGSRRARAVRCRAS
nr:IS110 family transposase [Streptomyces tirandamycinicus]